MNRGWSELYKQCTILNLCYGYRNTDIHLKLTGWYFLSKSLFYCDLQFQCPGNKVYVCTSLKTCIATYGWENLRRGGIIQYAIETQQIWVTWYIFNIIHEFFNNIVYVRRFYIKQPWHGEDLSTGTDEYFPYCISFQVCLL